MTQTVTQQAVPAKRSARFWLVAAMLALAWLLAIRQLSLDWSVNPQYQYGWIVPILTVVLWFQIAPERPAAKQPANSALGIVLVALLALLAIPARIVEEANPDWRMLNGYFAFQAILLTAWVVYQTGGAGWLRHFAFPLLFPLISLPWPSAMETALIQGLQHYVAILGAEAATWMGWSATARGNVIVLPTGVVGISEACSGIRSLQTSLMIALFMGQYLRLSRVRRFVLIGLSILFAFGLNLCRAFLLISIMASQGLLTMEKFHDPAGITISLGTLLLLWITAFLLAPKTLPATGTATEKKEELRVKTASNPRLGFPWVYAGVLIGFWLLAEGINQAWFYTIESQNLVAAPVWTLKWPPVPNGFDTKEIDEATAILLHYDEGRQGTWADQFGWEIFYFKWNPGRASAGLAQAHHPDVCMPAAGFVLKQQYSSELLSINGVEMPFTRFVFADPNSGEPYYVFQCVTNDQTWRNASLTPAEASSSLQRLEAAWEGRRNPGQRSLLIINRGAESIDQAESAMKKMMLGCVQSG